MTRADELRQGCIAAVLMLLLCACIAAMIAGAVARVAGWW